MKHYDLAVIGGGIAGVGAAVSAAREGLSVLLVERDGALGGAMSSGLVYPFMKHFMGGNKVALSAGIFSEMKARKIQKGDVSYESFKFVFDDMATEAGVDLLFHACLFAAKTDGRRVTSVSVAVKGGTLEISADNFIDATGDGELIALAGCAYRLGRESDGYCQPMTTCFRVSGIDIKKFADESEKMQKLYKEYRAAGKIKNPRENVLCFYGQGDGVVHFNTTRVIMKNPVDPFELSAAEVEARGQIEELMRFFRENLSSFEKANLISIATHIGVRESRKLLGEYVLTADDLVSGVEFPDTVALGNYDIDIHNPTGTGTHIHEFADGEYYRIPYRSLLPKEYDNLLVAGRCLSATHEAHAAVRIMPICACLGEAAGCAVAVAVKTGRNTHTLEIPELRKTLLSHGAALSAKMPE